MRTRSQRPSRSASTSSLPARRPHLDVAGARAGEPREDRREPVSVRVGGVDLALVFHRRGERERLAAGPGAEVEDLHARLGFGQQRRELRALVLHFDQAFDIGRVGGERRRAPVGAHGDAQADRGEWRRLGREIGKRGERLVARGFQEVDAQIDRRPLRQRPALVRGLVAEARLELRREPLGKIPRDMGRRAGKVGGGEPLPLGVGQRRRRVSLARRTAPRSPRRRARASASARRGFRPAASPRP